MSELRKFSPQHRGGLDAGDTDSLDLTPDNHGPHRMIVNKRQTSAKMVTKYLELIYLMHQNGPQSYPNTATFAEHQLLCIVFRSWRHLPMLERILIGKLS